MIHENNAQQMDSFQRVHLPISSSAPVDFVLVSPSCTPPHPIYLQRLQSKIKSYTVNTDRLPGDKQPHSELHFNGALALCDPWGIVTNCFLFFSEHIKKCPNIHSIPMAFSHNKQPCRACRRQWSCGCGMDRSVPRRVEDVSLQ